MLDISYKHNIDLHQLMILFRGSIWLPLQPPVFFTQITLFGWSEMESMPA